VIIICPNCGTRYRLDAAVVARGARMRCAECQHRWVPTAEPDVEEPPPEPVVAVAPPPPEPPVVPPVPPPASDEADADDDAPPRRTLWRWIVAIGLGAVLAAAVAALWIARVDPERLPVLSQLLAQWQPAPSLLKAEVTGIVTRLPSGERVIEISGRVRNPGRATESIKGVDARLSGGGGTARRWRINVPVRQLAPGESVGFASTTPGFAADAVILSVTPIP
jgi:predicted Zn finger-like uncharacterized protein